MYQQRHNANHSALPTHPPTHPLHTLSRVPTVASACAHELEELDLEPSDDPLVVGPDLVLAVHVLAGPGLPGGGGSPKDNEDNIGAHITPYLD